MWDQHTHMLDSQWLLLVQKLCLIVTLLTTIATQHLVFRWAYILYTVILLSSKIFAPLPPSEWLVPIVGIVATNNLAHLPKSPLNCVNALLSRLLANGYGVPLHLKKTLCGDLAAYFVLPDRSDGCRVAFSPREHAVGPRVCFLDGVVVRMIEVYTPEHPNRFCCALYHRNRSYGMVENVDDANL